MSTDQDRDGFAAEYVLGTLDTDERAQADALMLVDPVFAATVKDWERRLGELNGLVTPVEPPDDVWTRIREALPETGQVTKLHLPEIRAALVGRPAADAEIVDLTQRVRRWRALAGLAGALAACLVGVVVLGSYRPQMLPAPMRPAPQVVERIVEKPVEVVKEVVREVPAPQPARFVAVFQKDEQSPAFLLTVDVDKRMVTVRPVAADRPSDKTYQLWIAAQPGAPPRSLGLIGEDEFTVRTALSDYDPAVISSATYGISLEPLGGSPTGLPTGPVIHAKLVQATP